MPLSSRIDPFAVASHHCSSHRQSSSAFHEYKEVSCVEEWVVVQDLRTFRRLSVRNVTIRLEATASNENSEKPGKHTGHKGRKMKANMGTFVESYQNSVAWCKQVAQQCAR